MAASELPFGEVDRIAMTVIHAAQHATGSRNTAIVGTALALGRLTSDKELTTAQEIKFTEDTLGWCKAYWYEGRPS